MKKRGQSIIEYLLIAGALLAALVASGFIAKSRNSFNVFFDKAVEKMR